MARLCDLDEMTNEKWKISLLRSAFCVLPSAFLLQETGVESESALR